MDFFLVGGYPNTGKTAIIKLIEKYLKKRGFNPVTTRNKTTNDDFVVVYEGSNQKKTKIRILLNSASDSISIIDQFYDYYQQNQSVDIVISSIRDAGAERDYLLKKFNLVDNSYIEVPLAKISGKRNDYKMALNQYQQRIMKLIEHILCQNSFNL